MGLALTPCLFVAVDYDWACTYPLFMCRRRWWLGLHLPPSLWWGLHLPRACFFGLALTLCLTMGLALYPLLSIWLLPKTKKITITEGTLLRIWVLWSRWCLSYNHVLVPHHRITSRLFDEFATPGIIIMLQGEENPDNPLQRTIVGPRAGLKTL
jgi:hypothetical protein